MPSWAAPPGRGGLARARDALADGRQRDLREVDAVPGRPARPRPPGHRLPGLLPVRRRRRRLPRPSRGSFPRALWLDGALGAAGAATALAVVLNPVLSGIEGDLAEVLVGAAYPVADLLLVAMICGLLAVRGLRGGSMWLWLAGGLAIFCAGRRRLRAARGVGHLRRRHDPGRAVGARGHVHRRSRIWRPRAASRDRLRPLDGDPRDPDAGHAHRRSSCSSISSFEQQAAVVVALATFTLLLAARPHARELPAGPAALRRPAPGRHRRAHRARQPPRPVRARRTSACRPRIAPTGSR